MSATQTSNPCPQCGCNLTHTKLQYPLPMSKNDTLWFCSSRCRNLFDDKLLEQERNKVQRCIFTKCYYIPDESKVCCSCAEKKQNEMDDTVLLTCLPCKMRKCSCGIPIDPKLESFSDVVDQIYEVEKE